MSKSHAVEVGGNVGGSTIVAGDGNIVVHIYDQVYNRDELQKLIDTSFELKDLLEFWRQVFLAQELPSRKQTVVSDVIDDFKQKNELSRLLSEVKKRNSAAYREFIAKQPLDAVGLSQTQIPKISMDSGIVRQKILRAQKPIESDSLEDDEIEFENQTALFEKTHTHDGSHILIYGPSGVGKTHFLRHYKTKFPDTCCVYIDLKLCPVSNILHESVRQLRGEDQIDYKAGYQELAQAINEIHRNSPHIIRFFFLFDCVDENQDAVDFLFGLDNLIDEKEFRRLLETWSLAGQIDLKIIMTARNLVKPQPIYSPFQQSSQIKYDLLDRANIQTMLEKLAIKRRIPAVPNVAKSISADIFHLTGGHPKCAKQILLALAKKGFPLLNEDEKVGLHRRHVMPIIRGEMLSDIDIETLTYIWSLCIFRRFDQRLLGGLLERNILPALAGEISRQARELRSRLEQTHLSDSDDSTATMTMNYALRHVLALNMKYDFPDRYKALHALALGMFLERLQSTDIDSDKAVERTVMHLLEIVYHWAKILEIETPVHDRQSQYALICERLKSAFERYLSLAFTLIRESDQADFFSLLKKKWEADVELHETINRATFGSDCYHGLTQVIVEKQLIRQAYLEEDQP